MLTRRDFFIFGGGAAVAAVGTREYLKHRESRWIDVLDQRAQKYIARSDRLDKQYSESRRWVDKLTERSERLDKQNVYLKDQNAVLKNRIEQIERTARVKPGTLPKEVTIAAVIRNTGSGWYIMDGRYHSPVNVDRLVQYDDYVELFYAVSALRVHSVAVQADDWFVSHDTVRAGVSYGLESLKVYFGRDGKPVSPRDVYAPTGNFFITGTMTCLIES